jgi:DNA-binding transcriptional regulator YiaG
VLAIDEMRAHRLLRLRSAVAGDADPDHRVEHEATVGLLDRCDRAAQGNYPAAWDLFAGAASKLIGKDGWGLTVGVMANMVAIVDLGDAEDLVTSVHLVERHGNRTIASAQASVDTLLGSGPAMPLATRAVNVLARRDSVDPDARGPLITTPEEIATCDGNGINGWRGQVAHVAANPWNPYVDDVTALAVTADRPVFAAVLSKAKKIYVERFERRERELVGKEIRRLVAVSGLTQREFARRMGTSASRVSTYVNGLVTPSASMMIRIQRVSRLAEEHEAARWMQLAQTGRSPRAVAEMDAGATG